MDGVQVITDEMPSPWCSCDPLRRAEAERDRYRAKALRYSCAWKSEADDRCNGTPGDCPRYPCEAVIEEVDGWATT